MKQGKLNAPWRLLLCLLAVVLIVAIVPTVAFADDSSIASGTCGNNVTWVLDNEGTLTISGTGAMTADLFYSPWYSYQGRITEVVVEKGVTSIGNYAFFQCSSLITATISGSVYNIGTSAFNNCRNLTTVTLLEGVTNIGSYAFSGCTSLASIAIPDSMFYIELNAFSDCTSLKDVYYGGTWDGWKNNTYRNSGNEALTNATVHCTDITRGTCGDNLTWTLDSEGTLTISGTGAMTDFEGYDDAPWYSIRGDISTVVIANGVTGIGTYAFENCNSLTSITISDSVTSIGDSAFNHCTNLTDVNYDGSKDDWEKISIGANNEKLLNATIHFAVTVPTISKQPSDLTVSVGSTAKFTVTVEGDDLTYQWQYRTSESGKWKNSTASGYATETVKVKGTAAKNGYQYRCKITDANEIEIYSDVATLYVFGVTKQPSNVTVSVGSTAKFTVTAIGQDLTYQWQYRTSETGSWKKSSATGATTNTLSVKGTAARNGYQYRCKITDASGAVIYSDVATLYVVGVTNQPADVTVSVGSTAKFTVTTTGDNLTYQWQYRTSKSGSWKNSTASSATTKTVSVKGTAARNGYQFRCKITDANGVVIYSNAATLNVSNAVITKQPSSTTVSVGSTAKFTVTTTGDNLTYQWQYRTGKSGSWKNSTASGCTTKTVKIKGTAAKNGYQYRCKITDANGTVIYTNAATLSVSNAAITKQPSSTTVSVGSTAKFTVTTTGDNLTYQWQYRTSKTGSWKNSTASGCTTKTVKIKGTAARNGYQFRCKITDANGVVIYTNAATLTVK